MRLLSLLLESQEDSPMAIFMAGSAGAGKSSFRRKYIDSLGEFIVLNLDDDYEELLKKAGLPLDFRKFTSADQLSIAGQAMGKAQKTLKGKYQAATELGNLKNIIIDGTGASKREIVKKKQELESLGYKTMMVLVFVTPDVSLRRNIKRGDEGGRTLMPAIILRTWSSLFDNINEYEDIFGDDLIVYKAYSEKDIAFPNFDPSDANIRKAFFDPFKVKGKEKTPEEREESIAKIKALNDKILSQMQNIDRLKFDGPQEITRKLNKFVNA
jgi:predicted ABC-type ATPase